MRAALILGAGLLAAVLGGLLAVAVVLAAMAADDAEADE